MAGPLRGRDDPTSSQPLAPGTSEHPTTVQNGISGSQRDSVVRPSLRCKAKTPLAGCGVRAGYLAYSTVWLEVDLASKLEDSRVKCRRHLAESAVAKVGADGIELRMVPGVEGF